MAVSISDNGVQFSNNNIADLRSTVPSSGSYTAGDIVLESTTGGRVSGWKRLTTGAAHVVGTDWVYFSAGTVLATAQNTTSGTNIDFTSIPSWVKRITVMFNGVSTNGGNSYLVQLGSGSITASGYLGGVNMLGVVATRFSSGFMVANSVGASSVCHGMILLAHMGGNIWTMQGTLSRSDADYTYVSAGQVPLAGVLDRLRLTTVGGTDTFDAGSVNILYE